MQIPGPKGRTVTGAFYKNVVLKKLKAHFKRRRPKVRLKYLRLLHDNAPTHKAHIMTKFLEYEKVKYSQIPFFYLTLLPVIISCFSNSKFHLTGKRYKSRHALGSDVPVYQILMGVPIQDFEQCFQNWIDIL